MAPKVKGRGVLLCLGDSHTVGQLGTAWADVLEERTKKRNSNGKRFITVNAGNNGDMSVSVLRRVMVLVGRHTTTRAAILLCGTNDLLAAFGDATPARWGICLC